jgi:hypothetical protein
MVAMKTLEAVDVENTVDVRTLPKAEAIAHLMKSQQLTEAEATIALAVTKGEVTRMQKVMIDGEELTFV